MASKTSSANVSKIDIEIANPRLCAGGDHIEYEVAFVSVEPVPGMARNRTLRWTLWKRYKEFAALDAALRKKYGHAMAGIEFPGSRWFGNMDPGFIVERQRGLARYTAKVIGSVQGAVDFGTFHGSEALAEFMQWSSRESLALGAPGSGAGAGGGAASPASSAALSPTVAAATAPAASASIQQQRRAIQAMNAAPAAPTGWTTAPVGATAAPATPRQPLASAAPAPSPKPSTPAAAPAAAPARAAPAPAAAAAPAAPPQPSPAAAAAAAVAAGAPPPDADRNSLLASIQAGKKLKKAVTVDKSKPRK